MTCSVCACERQPCVCRFDRQPAEQVVAGLTTTVDKMVALFCAGYDRSEIARCVDSIYQHAYNELHRKGFKEPRVPRCTECGSVSPTCWYGTPQSTNCSREPSREQDATPAAPESEQKRTTVGPGGRVVIPAEYRAALGIKEGDALIMRLDGEELHLVSDATETRRIREMIARYVPEGVSLVDELIRERRREAAAEESM